MLCGEDLRKILEPYRLRPDDLTFVRHSQNSVYRCQRRGKKCIIRISKGRHRSKTEMEAELSWISVLKGRGVETCAPIPAENGESCLSVELDGKTYLVTCFEHAPGREVRPQEADDSLYQRLGRVVGRLHAESAQLNAEGVLFARTDWNRSRLLQEDFTEVRGCLADKFCSSVADLIQKLGEAAKTVCTYGLIHGDVSFGNLFLDDDDLWIIDFDNCEYGYFLQDLGTVLWDTMYCKVLRKFADEQMTERILPLWKAFLLGYGEAGTLELIEPEQLKRFFLLREAIIYVHYHRTMDVEKADGSFKAGLEVIRSNVENQKHQVDFGCLLENLPQRHRPPLQKTT